MGKKSAAQIKRMKKRAAARGEVYAPPSLPTEANTEDNPPSTSVPKSKEVPSTGNKITKDHIGMVAAAEKLRKTLAELESKKEMNSKQRRSAKRKAEAIAAEESGCSTSDLLKWHDQNGSTKIEGVVGDDRSLVGGDHRPQTKRKKQNQNPYIIFIGQLSYTTTKKQLLEHFQRELGKKVATDETLRIRLLTDPKNKSKSRGMAFVEVSDPELMYECLKLHHTHLDGRRINVERTTGGGKNSEVRRNKLKQFRKDQEEYMSQTVEKILADHKSNGDLEDGELDDGVISLCKRHSAATVEAALAEYVEARGREMENPSAYLTHIVGRIAVDGVESEAERAKHKKGKFGRDNDRRGGEGRRVSSAKPNDAGVDATNRSIPREGGTRSGSLSGEMGQMLDKASEFAREGIDMSISKSASGGDNNALSRIFPSMTRGRGRG